VSVLSIPNEFPRSWCAVRVACVWCGSVRLRADLHADLPTCLNKRYGVTDIIRTNKKLYDASKFTGQGFKVHELFFIDGTTPSTSILQKFIQIAEGAKGAVAVHCKAGLGRTGTLIACYLMKHYMLTSAECIGWMRVCRPGTVIGPQQYYLGERQTEMWRAGSKVCGLEVINTPAQMIPSNVLCACPVLTHLFFLVLAAWS
jgi:protein-tyrosine phosphatase